MADLLIGEVAARSGLTRKALRLYEERGILQRARRTDAGYRVYPADVLGTLSFVAQARRLGLTLNEIAEVTAQRHSGKTPCGHVRVLLEQKAHDLAQMLGAIRSILDSWPKNQARHGPVCPRTRGGDGVMKKSCMCVKSAKRPASAKR